MTDECAHAAVSTHSGGVLNIFVLAFLEAMYNWVRMVLCINSVPDREKLKSAETNL